MLLLLTASLKIMETLLDTEYQENEVADYFSPRTMATGKDPL